jgi:hypothetical protein
VSASEYTDNPKGWPGEHDPVDAPWTETETETETENEDEPLEFDPCDSDFFIGEVLRRFRRDEVAGFTEHGIPAFFATRERRLPQRIFAMVLGYLTFMAGLTLVGGITGVFGTGSITGYSIGFFIAGVVASVVAGWMMAQWVMPMRPILLHFNLDPERPDIGIGPVKRIWFGRPVLAVVDRERGLIGYLVKEDSSKYCWSAAYPSRLISFRVAKKPGSSAGLIFFSFLFPPVGWVLMAYRISGRFNTAIAVVNGSGKKRYGSIRPSRGLRGDLTIDMSDDPYRSADRLLVIAAGLAVAMHS